MKKEFCKIFKENGLKITIEANKKVINFLDVTLNLTNGKFYPYMKPGNQPTYVNSSSNHPPCVLKAIPEGVNTRLCSISSDAEVFDRAAPPYQKALKESGFNHVLKFSKPEHKIQQRRRNITWFNPPYDANLNMNLGNKFLNIVDQCFPKGSKLSKLINRNTVKLSYCCMPNIETIIEGHNRKLTKENPRNADERECNCRQRDKCPLEGACKQRSVVYQATVTEDSGGKKTYVGLTEGEFKTRWNAHNSSFKNEKYEQATELSKHIWDLKRSNTNFKTSWKVLDRTSAYSNRTKRCNLCLLEKYYILFRPDLATLNKKLELVSCCRHAAKFLLKNAKKKPPDKPS